MTKEPPKKKSKSGRNSDPLPKSFKSKIPSRYSLPNRMNELKSTKRKRLSYIEIAKAKGATGEISPELEGDGSSSSESEESENETSAAGSTFELTNEIGNNGRAEMLLKYMKEGAILNTYYQDNEEINKNFKTATKRSKVLFIDGLVEGIFPEMLGETEKMIESVKACQSGNQAIKEKNLKDVKNSDSRFAGYLDRLKELEAKSRVVNQTWEREIESSQQNCDDALKRLQNQFQTDIATIKAEKANLLKKKK